MSHQQITEQRQADLMNYIDFKMSQYIRCTGFKGPKEEFKAKVAPLIDGWVEEYFAAARASIEQEINQAAH